MPLLPVFHPVFNYCHLTFLLTAPKPNTFRTLLYSPSLSLIPSLRLILFDLLSILTVLLKYFIMSLFKKSYNSIFFWFRSQPWPFSANSLCHCTCVTPFVVVPQSLTWFCFQSKFFLLPILNDSVSILLTQRFSYQLCPVYQ